MRKILRGAIIGCGAIANISHMPTWKSLDGVEIVAACDEVRDAAARIARRFHIGRSYQDLTEMLESENLDFVDISTPPATHSSIAIKAMETGAHVLVEKPMALTSKEAEEMVAASKKYNVKLCVVHNLLFLPVIKAARLAIEEGEIGEMVSSHIESLDQNNGILSRQNHWCHSLPGGIFGEYAPHTIYLQQVFLGTIRNMKAIAGKNTDYPWVQADELKVIVEAERGLGTITISCNSPSKFYRINIFGTKGQLHIDNHALTMVRTGHRGYKVHEIVLDQMVLGLKYLARASSSFAMAALGQRWYKAGHRGVMEGFVESIRHDCEPPVTGEDGVEITKVLEQIWPQIR